MLIRSLFFVNLLTFHVFKNNREILQKKILLNPSIFYSVFKNKLKITDRSQLIMFTLCFSLTQALINTKANCGGSN